MNNIIIALDLLVAVGITFLGSAALRGLRNQFYNNPVSRFSMAMYRWNISDLAAPAQLCIIGVIMTLLVWMSLVIACLTAMVVGFMMMAQMRRMYRPNEPYQRYMQS